MNLFQEKLLQVENGSSILSFQSIENLIVVWYLILISMKQDALKYQFKDVKKC